MPLTDFEARDHAVATLHKLIESQSVHLSGTSLGMGQTHEGRAKNDVEYIEALFKGLVEIYRKAP